MRYIYAVFSNSLASTLLADDITIANSLDFWESSGELSELSMDDDFYIRSTARSTNFSLSYSTLSHKFIYSASPFLWFFSKYFVCKTLRLQFDIRALVVDSQWMVYS